jgi:hypothetical protein
LLKPRNEGRRTPHRAGTNAIRCPTKVMVTDWQSNKILRKDVFLTSARTVR